MTRARRGEALAFLQSVLDGPADGEGCITWPFAITVGYASIGLNGKTEYGHELVCTAFHGPRPTGMEARHSCPQNRRCMAPWHLSWGTHAENANDMIRDGTSTRGERNPNSALTESDVKEIRSLLTTETQAAIARRYGVSRDTIGKIARHERWAWMKGEI